MANIKESVGAARVVCIDPSAVIPKATIAKLHRIGFVVLRCDPSLVREIGVLTPSQLNCVTRAALRTIREYSSSVLKADFADKLIDALEPKGGANAQ